MEERSMDPGIQILEDRIETATAEQLVIEYRRLYPERPVWCLVEDIQRQAMVYMNIIEQLKWGVPASNIKPHLENLGLVPQGTLPNPNRPALLDRAFERISRYRETLVDVVRRFGGDLLNELHFEQSLAATVQVNVGFPLSVSVGVQVSVGV